MKAADIILSAMKQRGATQKEVAAALRVKQATFSKHLKNNSLKAQELYEAAWYLGFRVILQDRQRETELQVFNKGVGPRVRRQIDGVTYDTDKASAICHTTAENGWWLELYKDSSGRYFVAHYTDWEGASNFLTTCPASEAKKLIEMNA